VCASLGMPSQPAEAPGSYSAAAGNVREVLRWNKALDPVDFVERGEEPRLEHASVPQISI